MPVPSLLIDQAVDATEFIFHALLYHREIYPKEAFIYRCYMDVPAIVCSHPAVDCYWSAVRPALKDSLMKNILRAATFTVTIAGVPLERHWLEYEFANDASTTRVETLSRQKSDLAVREFCTALNDCLRTLAVSCSRRRPVYADDDVESVLELLIKPDANEGSNLTLAAERFSAETCSWSIQRQPLDFGSFTEPEASLISNGFFKMQVLVMK